MIDENWSEEKKRGEQREQQLLFCCDVIEKIFAFHSYQHLSETKFTWELRMSLMKSPSDSILSKISPSMVINVFTVQMISFDDQHRLIYSQISNHIPLIVAQFFTKSDQHYSKENK